MRILVVGLVTIAALGACQKQSEGEPADQKEPPLDVVRAPVKSDLAAYTKDIQGTGELVATIETPQGTIHCKLLADKAPMTVANFIGLATGQKPFEDPRDGQVKKGVKYYDGITFHRVIPGFMIQGGDPLGQGVGGPGYAFEDEIDPQEKMAPGTLAMANTGRPVSNGGQFFVTSGSPSYLNGKHTIFGRCKEVEIVSAIENVPKSSGDTPASPVTMKVTISKQPW